MHGIVSQHGGGIDVEGGPDGGTSFVVYVPIVQGAVSTHRPVRGSGEVRLGGTGRILFAEDDEAVRRVVQEGLMEAGYDVVVAVQGGEAIDLFLETPNAFDLAILDVVMGGADGREVFRRIRAARPDLPILFSTGYDEAGFLEGLPKGRGVRTLLKPYAIGTAARRLTALLAARTADA